ncbi:MAG: hypothetical protein HKN91_01945 [Acidimicrobiia bacterium]|nr:hypothetical protein [Acidimicrobiia bacterium]
MKGTLRLGLVLALLASMLVAGAGPVAGAEPEFSETADQTWMTNGIGKVFSIATGGNKTFIGGSFTGMRETYNGSSFPQKYVAALDLWTGELIASFDPDVNGEVRAVAVSPDASTVYIGGTFTQVNGQTATRLAALNASNGNLKSGFSVTIPNHNVEAIEVDSDGDLFVGGSFVSVNGQGQRSLAKINGQTGALIGWDANITAGRVESLLLTNDESRLYIGTSIDEENKATYGDLFAVNPETANAVPGFNAASVDKPVLDISVTEDKIYLAEGGSGGTAEILRVSNGSRRERYRADGDVQTVEVIGDRAYFAGHWVQTFGPIESFHFVAVNVNNDNIDDSYWPRLNGTNGLHDMHFDGYHFWMGGHVTDGNPVARRGFARYSPVGGTAPLTPVIESGAEWAFRDDGASLGAGWRKAGFGEAGWDRGDAELGYGDGDETTVVASGPANNRHITTYFRRAVTVYDTSDIGYLEIQLRRDDGVVVYVNEAEVIRDNMPSGPINGATLALAEVTGSGESAWTRWLLSPDILNEGENIVAVEIHQASNSGPDITFDMKMLVDNKPERFIDTGATWRYLDTGASLGSAWRNRSFNDAAWKKGESQLGYGEKDEATKIKKGPGGDRHITSYFRRDFAVYDLGAVSTLELELLRDDGAVVYLNGTEVVRTNMPSGSINSETRASKLMNEPEEQKWLRYSLDPGLLVAGDNVLAVEIHQKGPKSKDHSFDARLLLNASPEVLVADGVSWRFHDKGVDKGTNWRNIAYAGHSNWDRGKAELGYGDGDEVTVVDSGPDGDHNPTTYFRRKFNVADPDVFSVLDIRLIRDDGAVIYINGTEVLRNNMPSGPITYDDWASGSGSGEDQWKNFTVSASLLVAGTNVVAVEIHQSGPNSSDISFNLELTGR